MSVKTQLSCYLLLVLLAVGCSTTDRERYGVPNDQRIFGKYFLDYNRDGVRDVLLIVEDSVIKESMKRHLWLFAGQPDSSLVRVIANEDAVPCAACTEMGDSTLTDVVVTDTSISYQQTVITKNDRYETKRVRFEYTNYKKWHLVSVDYTLECTDAEGMIQPGCNTAMRFHLDEQQLMPPMYLDEFDIYDLSPSAIYNSLKENVVSAIDFDKAWAAYYQDLGAFPENVVFEHENDQTKGLEWMFFYPDDEGDGITYSEWPDRISPDMELIKIIDKIGMDKLDRYVVSMDRRYVKIGEDTGGAVIYDPQFPCLATVYHFNNSKKKWYVYHGQRSFNSLKQIASFINSLHYHD